ncbi:S41 family peptidase [Salibacter halophilus]|uniref:PDZ domain-containing protein n=1 Tax=Salibacter halophilus TaxID=1803916 RepID=A0A6N6M7N2_9FLAO|nr:S41 family peptidase [Salibacter halophilus]KAB1065924.1 PDZ domain-containing protein [Salibacter halophilus]
MRKILFTGLLILAFTTNALHAQKDAEAEKKIQSFLRYVELAYVDSVNANELVETAIRSVLEDLDPHSVYIPKKDVKRANEPLVGKFEGVGIQFNILKDTIVVVSPIPGGPSEKLGIKSGDKIIKINDSTVAGVGFTNQDVIDNLRGPKGSEVDVAIKRRGEKKLLDFTIKRDKIPIYSVDASYMAEPGVGYIKLNRFAATSMDEINEAMDSLKDAGMENMILDLRGNSGGYLNVAIELADQFLKDDQLIVYTEGRAFKRAEQYATKKGKFEKGKLIVLIDEGSASASEIVSGAVQDWDRGIVIGRRSFGKGLVQKEFKLSDGSALRLTISRYHTPSGRCIQRPYEDGKKAYYQSIYDRLDNGELVNPDSIHLPDSLHYETLKKGRTVYGGGGIMPDIFVPADTSRGSDYYGKVIRKGIINDFSLDYLDQNRKKLERKYSSVDEFINNFEDKNLMDKFIAYAEDEGVEKDEDEIEKSKSLLSNSLKGLIARGLYGSSAYYQLTNKSDDAFNKALETFKSDWFDQLETE